MDLSPETSDSLTFYHLLARYMGNPKLSFQRQDIKRVNVHCFLGMYLDYFLTNSQHITVPEGKVNHRISVLHCASDVLWKVDPS